ncbi:MAG: diacylglycerol kinase [Acidimicrobiia bacterium]|nr:diacylglycerol kinase [Acidimicrobiia bacterium]
MPATHPSPIPDPGRVRRRIGPSGAQRVLATVALVTSVAALLAAAIATLRHPLLVAAMVTAVSATVLATSWALTTRSASRRRLALGVVVVAGAAVAGLGVVTVAGGPAAAPLLVTAGVLLAVSAVCAHRSLVVAPPYRRSFFLVPEQRRVTSAAVLLCNPRSGGGKVGDSGVLELCDEIGVTTVLLEDHDDLAEVAEDAARSGADALGMAGGDGSLAVVAEVAHRHGIPFVVVPTGTRNHLALDLGLDRQDPRQALSAFTCGEPLAIDRGEVNGRWFLNNVVFGVYAAAIERPEYRDAKLTTVLAEMPSLADPDGEAYDISVTLPDGTTWERPGLVVASNGPYLLRPPSLFGRRPSLTTGTLGLVVVRAGGSGPALLASAVAALGGEDTDMVRNWDTDDVTVHSPLDTVPSGIDGEGVQLTTPVDIRCHPRSLTLLVPPGTRPGPPRRSRRDRSVLDEDRLGDVLWTSDDV